jgi:hypothetical protein
MILKDCGNACGDSRRSPTFRFFCLFFLNFNRFVFWIVVVKLHDFFIRLQEFVHVKDMGKGDLIVQFSSL